jgi:hypothetical protein
MCFATPKYDPTKAEANEEFNLTKEEVEGYMRYRNSKAGSVGHIQTIGEWAKENSRGVYANPSKPPGELLGADAGNAAAGESYKPFVHSATAAATAASKPPPAPSLTDPQLDAIRQSQLMLLKAKRGRASTFLTGPAGVEGAPTLGRGLLLPSVRGRGAGGLLTRRTLLGGE